MKPKHVSSKHFLAQAIYSEEGQFLGLQERHDRCGTPLSDRVEVNGKIAFPTSAHGMLVVFPWAEGDADSTKVRTNPRNRDLKRMRQRRSSHACAYSVVAIVVR